MGEISRLFDRPSFVMLQEIEKLEDNKEQLA